MYYFTVLEPETDYNNIGTISLKPGEELTDKIQRACESHFDADITVLSCPDPLELVRGEADEVRVRVEQAGVTYEMTLDIKQTVIY